MYCPVYCPVYRLVGVLGKGLRIWRSVAVGVMDLVLQFMRFCGQHYAGARRGADGVTEPRGAVHSAKGR